MNSAIEVKSSRLAPKVELTSEREVSNLRA
jgi:hypothetical protein